VTRLLLAAAILILAVALVGRAVDGFSEATVDALAVAGLGLLAVGQALRAWSERSPRSMLILLLVLALGAFVLLD
jgi:hypothetical protein